ncbi:MAG: DDE-type integrase/transposase/recombinase [Desulfobulbus sp.]|nr:DDE-type integrase/transposase/recombinase [Desulfobulbus sp.]
MADHLPRLVDCARDAAAAGHGGKAAVYARYCREFGWLKPDGAPNMQRLHTALKRAELRERRARRSDAGAHALPLFEAEEIVRWQRENARGKEGCKAMVALADAVATLRSNGHIRAEFLDKATGELRPLSISAIRAAIKVFGLDDKTLSTPAPAIRMRVLHANHVWQVDASLCVLYYLPADGGLQVMRQEVFNDNKPKHIARIENERVWRYLVVDVASGCIYVEYVFGGESGANLTQVFINAMQYRRNEFWGKPKRVYCDAGAAMTGAVFKGLCQRLDIDLQWHLPGNARATGAVEKPQDIVERKFESMLASRPVFNLADLNAAAERWRVRFNATATHGRHGQTRLSAWMTHVAGHLVEPPSVEACRNAAHAKPVERRITQHLTVDFENKAWDASGLPGVYRNLKVRVVKNPWSDDSIRIVQEAADGKVSYFECPLKVEDDLGYWQDSPVMGEEYKRHAMTPPEIARAKLAARSAAEQAEAAASGGPHRPKAMPFGGKVDPFKPLAETFMPEMLPRCADAVYPLKAPAVHIMLTVPEAVRGIKERLGEAAPADLYRQIAEAFPAGHVPQAWAECWGCAPAATGTHDGAPHPHPGPPLEGDRGLRRVN